MNKAHLDHCCNIKSSLCSTTSLQILQVTLSHSPSSSMIFLQSPHLSDINPECPCGYYFKQQSSCLILQQPETNIHRSPKQNDLGNRSLVLMLSVLCAAVFYTLRIVTVRYCCMVMCVGSDLLLVLLEVYC